MAELPPRTITSTSTTTTATTVALVDDDPGMRQRLAAAVDGNTSMCLLQQFETGEACVRWLEIVPAIDVLLVDLDLPGISGIDVIRQARRLQPACDVMVVTMFADEDNMLGAFAAGARGYLLKDGTEDALAQHVMQLRAGGSPMSPLIARRLLQRWQERGAADPGLERRPAADTTGARDPAAGAAREFQLTEDLSPRERDVLTLVARGFTYEEAAQRIGISITTVRTHVRSIYSKLDVHNKTEAVFEARALGLLR